VRQHRQETQTPVIQLASDVLPAAFEAETRRLRFDDRGMEHAFLEDFAKRRLPQFRIIFWVGLAVQIPISLRFALLEDIGPDDARFWLRLCVGVIPAVAGLLLLRSPTYVRWAPNYIVFYVLLIGVVLAVIYTTTTTGWTFLATYLVAACIMSRLRAREAALVAVLLIGWSAFYSIAVVHKPAGTATRGLANLATTVIFILVAVYLIEHSARRDFVLLRLLEAEREKSERLLLNVLPASIAERLKESPGTVADSFADATVLFADIVDSSPNIARTSPEAAVELLNGIFTSFDRLADEHRLEKIKTVGDAYMVVGGLPEPRRDHADAVVAMALDMQKEIARFTWPTGEPLFLRVGINTGPVVAGVIGTRKFAYDLWGDTVNIASRMESHGTPGAIQITEATHRRIRRRHRFTRRKIEVKGRGPMSVYVLEVGGPRVAKPRGRHKAKATR
jgi:class 3 adenylate cyclase